jgi:hypothetical protein
MQAPSFSIAFFFLQSPDLNTQVIRRIRVSFDTPEFADPGCRKGCEPDNRTKKIPASTGICYFNGLTSDVLNDRGTVNTI